MIKTTIYQNHAGQYTGFTCTGHAGFAVRGDDIVCAAVSVLVINTLNAIEAFTADAYNARTNPDSGLIDIRFQHPAGHDGKLLLDTKVLGLQNIQEQYGTDYSRLTFEEV